MLVVEVAASTSPTCISGLATVILRNFFAFSTLFDFTLYEHAHVVHQRKFEIFYISIYR